MLCKDNGASLDALVKATSRLPHTTRAALTGLRKRGYAVEWVFGESKDSLYRIVEKARGGCQGLTQPWSPVFFGDGRFPNRPSKTSAARSNASPR
jgi:hypothetical protein